MAPAVGTSQLLIVVYSDFRFNFIVLYAMLLVVPMVAFFVHYYLHSISSLKLFIDWKQLGRNLIKHLL